LFDTRDDEFNPSRGGYHEVSLRGGAGPSRDRPIYYGALYLYTRWFFPVPDERLVIALRGLTELGGGSMPLVELGSIGGYTSLNGPAGLEANRGLPYGRQLGRVKLLASAELRSTFYHFTGFNQQFALGAAVFVDASRVWAQLGPSELDGGPFLRFAVGGGPRLVWGRGLVLRVDVGFGPGAGANGKNHVSGSLALGHAF
jgi:outer membrane protein assembly factor BamA